ncbi:hypothetical protein OAL10_10900 [Gammaproteobacteria bacterium]|nr:hypothetical protein [Gammaproteobacteria bacterium]
MNINIRFFLTIICSAVLLAGCVGTGTKDIGVYVAKIEADGTAVVIRRDTGYAGTGGLISVKIDGVERGTLGNKEVGIYDVDEGSHSINVHYKGVASIGMNSVLKSKQLNEGEKVFYTIQQEVGVFTTKLKMLELTRDGFYQN